MKRTDSLVKRLSNHSDSYIRSLALTHSLRRRLLETAVDWLDFPQQSCGMDLGCGIGLPAMVAACRRDLEITGVDIRPEFVETGRRLARQAGLEKQLNFVAGDGTALDFEDNRFDWAWSVDCVNYDPGMSDAPLSEMARVLKPGGTLALAAWSSQVLLPGYPELEARLNATVRGLAPFAPGMAPDRHFLRTGRKLKALGCHGIRVKSFIQDIGFPVSGEIQKSLVDLFKMRWGKNPGGLSSPDLDLYLSLTDPGSPDFILNTAGYYGFFTYTLFTGIKAG